MHNCTPLTPTPNLLHFWRGLKISSVASRAENVSFKASMMHQLILLKISIIYYLYKYFSNVHCGSLSVWRAWIRSEGGRGSSSQTLRASAATTTPPCPPSPPRTRSATPGGRGAAPSRGTPGPSVSAASAAFGTYGWNSTGLKLARSWTARLHAAIDR